MKFKTKPYKHQLESFNRFKDQDFFALFMEMGTGKTKVAIDVASYLFEKSIIDAVLLVAPNGVHYQWFAEQIPEHSPILFSRFLWDSKKFDRRHYQRMYKEFDETQDFRLKWFCINVEYFSTFAYERLFTAFMKKHRCFFIVDESTRIKNPNAKRTKNIIALSKLSHRQIILTGTPVTNSPFDLWSMFEFLKGGFWDCNYFVFKHRHGIFVKDLNPYSGKTYQRVINEKDYALIQNRVKKGDSLEKISAYTGISEKNLEYIISHPGFTGYKNLDRLKENIKPFVSYAKKEDCLDLPPKVYERIYVEFAKEQKRIYSQLVDTYLTMYKDTELSVQNKVSLTLRLMQVCGGYFPSPELKKPVLIGDNNVKIIRLIDELEEIGEERVIIWAHFVAEIEGIYDALKEAFPNWRIGLYYGKIDKELRKTLVKDFQNGNIKILVCNQQTASFGLNLQRSNLHYFFSNTYSLEHRLQAEDRSHRAGQKWPVVYKDLIIKKSVEEKVLKVLKNKMSLLDYFKNQSLVDLISPDEEL